jgi:hypothetical protein
VEGCGRRECRGVVRGFSEWAFVWGPGDHDVADDPHSGWHGPNDADFKFDKWSYSPKMFNTLRSFVKLSYLGGSGVDGGQGERMKHASVLSLSMQRNKATALPGRNLLDQ